MPKKILIDCDPGIDDAVALCLALFDPRVEVVGITATAGNVDGHQATSNVITILDQLDPPKWPKIGGAVVSDKVPAADARHIHGDDGLGDVGFVGAELHNQRPADKVISDILHEHPGEVTIVSLGPLTNLARAIQRERELSSMMDQIIMLGGAIEPIGNITAAAEFNMYCDPEAARVVFASPTTKTLIPLDVTRSVMLSLDFADGLPEETTRAGRLMRQIVPSLFRAYRNELGQEGIYLHAAIAFLYVVHAELFKTQESAGDVETNGLLTRGMTVFDRRPRPVWRNNMEIATAVDPAGAEDCIVRGVRFAGQNT